MAAVAAARNGKPAPALSEPTNAAEDIVMSGAPYVAQVTIRGVCPIIFHRYNCDSVEAKGKAAKGSEAKKTDDVESFVYRDSGRNICIPGVYLVGAITNNKNGSAKYLQDPRSPRKSALDLYKAGIIPLTELAPINGGVEDWDFLDRRRVLVQQNAVSRIRPAFLEGWTAKFDIQVVLPEYISPTQLYDVLDKAGKFVGIADNRPTYGRFQITGFDVVG